MEETLNLIAERLSKDFWDYFAMFTPLVLSTVAILISLWNSFWSINMKKIEANLIWDEAMNDFFVIIRNVGKKTIVVNSISLEAKDSSNGILFELGKRENLWTSDGEGYIISNQILKYSPCHGSSYDIFAYDGHGCCVIKGDEVLTPSDDLRVELKIKDMDGKTWKFRTDFSIGDIDKKLHPCI